MLRCRVKALAAYRAFPRYEVRVVSFHCFTLQSRACPQLPQCLLTLSIKTALHRGHLPLPQYLLSGRGTHGTVKLTASMANFKASATGFELFGLFPSLLRIINASDDFLSYSFLRAATICIFVAVEVLYNVLFVVNPIPARVFRCG